MEEPRDLGRCAARHLLLCHLPFAEDDTNGYLDAAFRAARIIDLPDIRLLTRPLQREEL
ncbi:hypothetical protein [uncultured Oscillibacter sp.]|uniref:hypothetical protein n=1 Tax=uncultured Oscillibacter sp. TaxID=876091 RepID=UPI0026147737|nr:hypothetical protein [uncultured Oscillibacter sp.]